LGEGIWFRVSGSGFRVWGFQGSGSGCAAPPRTLGLGVWVSGLGVRGSGIRFRVSGSGFRVRGLGFRGQCFGVGDAGLRFGFRV